MNLLGTIAAIWFAVSILLAAAWALGGRKIFRKPPAKPTATVRCAVEDRDLTTAEVVAKLNERLNGGWH